jgi:hypothetical protein
VPDQAHPVSTKKKPLTFLKLRTVPDQIYFTVSDVRTSDDAILQGMRNGRGRRTWWEGGRRKEERRWKGGTDERRRGRMKEGRKGMRGTEGAKEVQEEGTEQVAEEGTGEDGTEEGTEEGRDEERMQGEELPPTEILRINFFFSEINDVLSLGRHQVYVGGHP